MGAATLAEAGRLEAEAAGRPGLVFPLFMAGGWFTRVQIPDRLRAAGADGWQMLEPFGCLTALHDLTVRIAAESGAAQIVVAGHGSFKSPVPAAITRHVADGSRARRGSRPVPPSSTSRRGWMTCRPRSAPRLPAYFAMAGGHVAEDIPGALRGRDSPGGSCRLSAWTRGCRR